MAILLRRSPPFGSRTAFHALERRLLLAGERPDVSWADGGFLSLESESVQFVSAPPGGKVLAVGEARDHTSIFLMRMNADGTPDETFGSRGHGPLLPMTFVDVHAAAAQADGKIVVTGGDNTQIFLARFNADGTPDATFGTGGVFSRAANPDQMPFLIDGSQPANPIGGMVVQPDGRIVAVGRAEVEVQDGRTHVPALVRVNANGTLDTSFADGGQALPPIDMGNTVALALDGDGRILLTGTINSGEGTAFVARLNGDGSTDPTFGGGDGLALPDLPYDTDIFNDVLVTTNGRILIGGASFPRISQLQPQRWGEPMVLALNGDGTTDTTFAGGDGLFIGRRMLQPVGQGIDFAETITALTVDANGRILAPAAGSGHLVVYRLTPEGDADATFAPEGRLEAAGVLNATFASIQSDGRILVSGSGTGGIGRIARLTEPQPVELGTNGTLYVRGTDGTDSVTIERIGADVHVTRNGEVSTFSADDVTGVDVDTGIGGDRVNVLVGLDCVIRPGPGNDSIVTSTGNDRIIEDSAGSGRDTIRSNDGNDSIDAGDGDDRVVAGSGSMTIQGGSGDDAITAGAGRMTILGGTGNDTIDTGPSDHSDIFGNSGNDVINTMGPVRVIAGEEEGNVESDDDVVFVDGGAAFILAGEGDNQITVVSAREARIGGSPGNDLIITGSGDDRIGPVGGNDTIFSNGGDDLIQYLGDSDQVDTGSGDDLVLTAGFGPAADDTIHTAGGNDVIVIPGGGEVRAGTGNDLVDARPLPGAETLTGLPVTIFGHGGNDSIEGSSRNDRLYGGEGDDTIHGNAGADRLYGGGGNDVLEGGGGRDVVFGHAGNDSLFGGNDDDTLFADDEEIDLLHGGRGADVGFADAIDLTLQIETHG